MVEDSISTSDLPSCFWMAYLIVLAKESDDYIRKYYNVGKLNNKMDHDSGIFFVDTRMPVMRKVTE